MTNTKNKPFKVVEGNLHDMENYSFVKAFDSRWEAEQYVDENEELSNDAGCSLFIEGEDE